MDVIWISCFQCWAWGRRPSSYEVIDTSTDSSDASTDSSDASTGSSDASTDSSDTSTGSSDTSTGSNSTDFMFRYFSLQASEPLGFSDKVRTHVELNICREAGPLPDCFVIPKAIVLETIETVYSVILLLQIPISHVSHEICNLPKDWDLRDSQMISNVLWKCL